MEIVYPRVCGVDVHKFLNPSNHVILKKDSRPSTTR